MTEGLIVMMRDEVLAKQAKFLVTLSNAIQVYPDAAVRMTYMKKIGAETLFYPDSRIRALGERQGIPVLNLAPQLQLYADQRKVFLHGFAVDKSLGSGHWNEEGHRLAGEMIARYLCADILNH